MKKFIFATSLSIATLMANTINIEITNILNKNGNLYIGLYTSADDFTIVSKKYKGGIEKIYANSMNYSFKNIPNGTYAIAIFHDENTNELHDKNFFGIPTEGYGFSNNIRHIFRSANFDESKFEVHRDKDLIVHIGY